MWKRSARKMVLHNVRPHSSWCFPACRALIRSYLTAAGIVSGYWKHTDMAKHKAVPLKSDPWEQRVAEFLSSGRVISGRAGKCSEHRKAKIHGLVWAKK